jgi:dTDP-L-rhamnose 4-epimerase
MIDVVLPVLDEVEALGWVLGRMPPGYRAVVADNGSTDGSGEVARDAGALVVTEPRRGFGAACFAGLLACEADVVCFMDADGSLDPQHLPLVASPVQRGQYDLVLGARRPARGAWPLHARVGNRAVAAVVRKRTGYQLRDLGPMRAGRRTALSELAVEDRRFGWPLEMVVKAAAAGWRVGEVEVDYRLRVGRSKVTGTVRGTARTIADMRRVLA